MSLSHAFILPCHTKLTSTTRHRKGHFLVDSSHATIAESVITAIPSLDLPSFNPFGSWLDSTGIVLADTNTDTSSTESVPVTYSKWSYYTTLGLYVLSFPGIWSQIKRSTKAKLKRKTYVTAGEAVDGGKNLRQQAGEIMACAYRFFITVVDLSSISLIHSLAIFLIFRYEGK